MSVLYTIILYMVKAMFVTDKRTCKVLINAQIAALAGHSILLVTKKGVKIYFTSEANKPHREG